MWHIEPDSRIAVSVKRNAGQHTHAQCGAHGYRNIKPWLYKDLPPIRTGERHKFRAILRGGAVTLMADGNVVWKGDAGDQVLQFDGPVGFRTDNARFTLEYFVGGMPKAPATAEHATAGPDECVISAGD